MQEHWNDPNFVEHWNDVLVNTNPIRFEQIDILRSYFESLGTPGCCVLDIGCGTGLIAQALADCIPAIRWTGIDASETVLEYARRRRFSTAVVTWHRFNIATPTQAPYATHTFDCVLAVQVLHILDHEGKRVLMEMARDALTPQGTFFIMDRFFLPSERLYDIFLVEWERIRKRYGTDHQVVRSFEEYKTSSLVHDRAESIAAHLNLLSELGFETELVHVHGDRGLIAARLRLT